MERDRRAGKRETKGSGRSMGGEKRRVGEREKIREFTQHRAIFRTRKHKVMEADKYEEGTGIKGRGKFSPRPSSVISTIS